jgi:hypothetical protein
LDWLAISSRLMERMRKGKPKKRRVKGDCWLWTGYCNPDGYGQIRVGTQAEYTHRVACHICRRMPLRSPRFARHQCGNKSCFNPDHILIGSQAENNRDTVRDGCHSNKTLSDAKIRDLIRGVRSGRISIAKWAAINSVNYSTAHQAYNGITHKEFSAACHARADVLYGAREEAPAEAWEPEAEPADSIPF